MQQRSEETRSTILDAALHLFARDGYDSTGVAEICAAAGVSKGAFYHHFPTKQAVFLELLDAWLSDLDTQMVNFVKQATDVPQALLEMASMTRIVFSAADGRLPMFIEFWRQAIHHPDIWQNTIAPYRRYQNLFTTFLQQGIDEGSLRPDLNAEQAARTLVALAIGMVLQGVMDSQSTDWHIATVEGIRYLMDGMRKED